MQFTLLFEILFLKGHYGHKYMEYLSLMKNNLLDHSGKYLGYLLLLANHLLGSFIGH